MAKAKGTHVGHCQICGSLQVVLASGVIAKHGYQVQEGWGFVGTCHGSEYKPYEVTKENIPAFIAMLQNQVANEESKIAKIRNNETPALYIYRTRKQGSSGSEVASIEINLDNLPKILETGIKYSYNLMSLPPEAKIEFLRNQYISQFEKNVENLKGYIKHLEARINNWVEKPLIERVLEDKKPLIHLATKRFHVACAGSYMGGLKKASRATENKESVTCPKCLEVMKKEHIV
jgi:hypothetical protein